MNQILYEGWIFFPNHRVDMQAGVGLHMSHARQNLGSLGGFKIPLRSKMVFWGTKKRVYQLQNFEWWYFFFHYRWRDSFAIFGAHMSHPQQILGLLGAVNTPKMTLNLCFFG